MNSEEKIIRSIITPNDQTLRQVFSGTQPYYIDIYQREYKWAKNNVDTLLKDIEVRFNQHPRTKSHPTHIQEEVKQDFEPYFLNTYLTHVTASRISIVDGQQRLTTFLLIFIKLLKIVKRIEDYSELKGRTFSRKSLEKLIFESDDFGNAARFKIYNQNREATLRELVNDEAIAHVDETQKRINENYKTISDYYEKFFQTSDEREPYDLTKLTYYVSYLLDRISIVEIKIEKQKNVAMIFEVVNDRGLGLQPYEILKGKFIGNLPEQQKEEANKIWTQLQTDYFKAEIKNSTDTKLDLDMFFRTFFRAKFADSENDYEKFEGPYHYEIYQRPKIQEYFGHYKDPNILFNRISQHIKYFAEFYLWLRTTYDNEYLIFNKLLDQNQQYLLIMSATQMDEPNRNDKVTAVARKFDQLHTVLRLLEAYDSNAFQRLIYRLNREIRDKNLEDICRKFDERLLTTLAENEIIREDEVQTIRELFTYERFRGVRNHRVNFSKYILMRIDRYLSTFLDKPSYAGGNLKTLEDRFNKFDRKIYGMHLEHIYAFNKLNKKLFTNERGFFDEQDFKSTRELLGMVMLLKDRQNESIGAKSYAVKFSAYKESNFIWNELMAGALGNSDLRKIPPEWELKTIEPQDIPPEWELEKNEKTERYEPQTNEVPVKLFPKDKIDSRQRSVYALIKQIWLDEVDKLQ